MRPPLAGLLVIESASVLAGPAVGMFLAELGARVVKIENPRGGDVTRSWKLASEAADSDISAYFTAVNWGKSSIALDLREPAQLEIFLDLIKRADVHIASWRPGDDEKLGVSYDRLRALRPTLIQAEVNAYGEDDPRPGYDAVIQAEAGFMFMNGDPDGPPLKMPVALMDLLAAHQLKEAILLALYQRGRSGEGARVTAALYDSAVASLANQAANWLVASNLPRRMGSEHPNIVPYGAIFECSAGESIVLAAGTDRHFASLCIVLGRRDLAEDQRFATNQARVANRAELMKLLRELVAARERAHLLEALAREGVPAGAVNDLEAVFSGPRTERLTFEAGNLRGVRSAVFDSPILPFQSLAAPPHLDQDAEAVMREVLCYTPEQIAHRATNR